MYVRIARFENTDGNWEERIEEVRRRMRGDGDTPIGQARGAVKRAIMLPTASTTAAPASSSARPRRTCGASTRP